MIHRQNWLDIKAYLRHIERVRQNDPETVSRARAHLRHLLEWADATPLTQSRGIDPTFPAYLLTARADGRKKTLAPASIRKCLSNARLFFAFASDEWRIRYKTITATWIESLQPPRQARSETRLVSRKYYQLEEVLKIARVSTETLREERGKVGACMLFLSGMRADALASMPLSCVHLADRQIDQLPEFGVRTKNRKAAITYLLDIPELLDVCHRWDSRLQNMTPASLWYSNLATDGMTILPVERAYAGRNDVIEEDLRLICKRAGVVYQSPHKLRHGHVVYALKLSRNMAEAKAISQNVMHASVVITDQVYGKMISDDVRDIIGNLGRMGNS